MHSWSELADIPAGMPPTAVTIGNFDGVHRGHRSVIETLAHEAAERALLPVALTFWPHPVAVMRPDHALETITAPKDRERLLCLAGAEAVLTLDFTLRFAQLTPSEFVRRYLVDGLGARLVVLGRDARFGRGNAGTIDTMRELGAEMGFEVLEIGDVGSGAGTARVSSSAIREDLRAGDVTAAAAALGRWHTVSDTVRHGFKRGRELGFPTANLGPAPDGMVPADGVYAGYLTVIDRAHPGRAAKDPLRAALPSAISVGTNPTFESTKPVRTVEAYVLDRDDLDLYDDRVRLEFVKRLRPTVAFDGIEALVAQMRRDADESRIATTGDGMAPASGRW